MTVASATTLARARAGDQSAFSDLVNPYRRQLLVHCYRILGSVQDAEDVLQEVLLSAWRALGQFDGGSFRAWLYRIATNRCLNYFATTLAVPPGSAGGAQNPPGPTSPGGSSPSRTPCWTRLSRRRSPVRIPRVDRTLVRCRPPAAAGTAACRARLRDVLGFSASETADILGSTQASVNKRVATSESRLSAIASC